MSNNRANKSTRKRLFRELVGTKKNPSEFDDETLLLVLVHDAVGHLMSAMEKISKLQPALDRLALAVESATQTRGLGLMEPKDPGSGNGQTVGGR